MRIFLTGATGVVGRRLIPLLTAAGHEVTAVGRTSEKRAQLERAGATPVTLDLFNGEGAWRAFTGHEVVINLATHIPSSTLRMLLPGGWRENDRIRREGSATLVDAAVGAGVRRFIQESFAPIYEEGGARWLDEDAPVRPVRYNRSILDAERAAERVTATGGEGIVLRFAAFYGPDATQVHDMIRAVKRGWSPLPGAADAFFSSVSHDDAATAVAATLDVPAGIYHVVDDEPLRRRDYANALADALGVSPPRMLPAWTARLAGSLGELLSRSLRISNQKLRAASGWRPLHPSAREGWREVVAAIEGDRGGALKPFQGGGRPIG